MLSAKFYYIHNFVKNDNFNKGVDASTESWIMIKPLQPMM